MELYQKNQQYYIKQGWRRGRQEGREEGRQKGRQEGREEGCKEGHLNAMHDMACKLLRRGDSPAEVKHLTGLSDEILETLVDQVSVVGND